MYYSYITDILPIHFNRKKPVHTFYVRTYYIPEIIKTLGMKPVAQEEFKLLRTPESKNKKIDKRIKRLKEYIKLEK